MRSVLLASAAIIAFAAPAHARGDAQDKLDRAGSLLSSPIAQDVAAAQMSKMLAAILDIRVDGIARALEPLDRGRTADRLDGRTLGDLARRDDPYFDERIEDGTRRAVGSAGVIAKALASAMPELERAARRLEDAVPAR